MVALESNLRKVAHSVVFFTVQLIVFVCELEIGVLLAGVNFSSMG